MVPTAAVIAYLVNPANTAFSVAWLKEQAEAANRLGVRLLILNASSPSDIERASATLVEQQAGALLVGADTFFVGRRDELVALAARYRIPTSYFRREFTEAGGLISYAATAVTLGARRLMHLFGLFHSCSLNQSIPLSFRAA